MPALSDIVQTNITASSATPSVPGFGKPLVLSQNVPAGFTSRYREYSSDAGAITDGYSANHPTVKALQKGFSQNPRPPIIGVGRRANKTTQSVQFTLGSAVAGDVYSLTLVRSSTGVTTTVTRTSTGVPATDATAFAATIAAVSGFAGTAAVGAVITIPASADGVGTINEFKNWTVNGSRSTSLTMFDNSADPGIAADLAAIRAENDTWYGLSLDSNSKAEISAAAAWTESNNKLLIQQSSDSGVPDSGTSTDIMSVVQSAAYGRTGILYNGNDSMAFAGLEWQSFRFAGSPTPGNDTWAYNTLSALTADALTETEFSTIGTKNGTAYVVISGVNYTAAGGVSTSKSGGKLGSGMFIDLRRGLDWSNADIQVSIFVAIAPGTGLKTPFTDKGLTKIQGALIASLQRGENAGVYADGSTLVVVPTAAGVNATDRANRVLSGLTWSGQAAGAVHLAVIGGNVTT